MRPWLPAEAERPPPIPEKNVSTLGSLVKKSATSIWWRFMSSNEMPCCASVMANIWLVSSVGRKPLGMRISSQTDAPTITNEASRVAKRCRRTTRSVDVVDLQHAPEEALEQIEQVAVLLLVLRLQEPAAQHRRQAQRDESRHQNRDADGHGKLAQQAPDDAAHEQHRQEHHRQRDRHRQDRKGDLARALQRGFVGAFAHLDVADDVFEHDDGVVDHEADRERQRHQRKIVDAVVEQIHHRERADDRHRHRHAGDDRRRQLPQEQEDHQDRPDRSSAPA